MFVHSTYSQYTCNPHIIHMRTGKSLQVLSVYLISFSVFSINVQFHSAYSLCAFPIPGTEGYGRNMAPTSKTGCTISCLKKVCAWTIFRGLGGPLRALPNLSKPNLAERSQTHGSVYLNHMPGDVEPLSMPVLNV
jgi:hypothetical protein